MAIPLEDKDSWENYLKASDLSSSSTNEIDDLIQLNGWDHRQLNKEKRKEKKAIKHDEKERRKKLDKLLFNPGIQVDTMHGLMIDAGSTGSRMHVYEFKKRILQGEKEISEAVSGRKLSYPGTDSRWTERLSPGLASFSTKSDEELVPAITEYLRPLIEFAETVLHSKSSSWSVFPIYLKGTAGLRLLEPQQRMRVMDAVRKVFKNPNYNSFKFEKEYARVISGEEEAIYGWTAANFVLGSLLQSSEGSGTVMNPKLTHGAIEMGGASSQISFYQDNEDIMSNLFKLQIGQGKHWNVYAHSHLCFGINEAWDRMGAYLATNHKNSSDVGPSVYNPCLPLGSELNFESSIHFENGKATWNVDNNGNPVEYKTTLISNGKNSSYDECSDVAYALLNKEYNGWCNFSHHGSCSFSGVYQPSLPIQSKNFGEFLAFSNYYHIWQFLKIPPRSSLRTLDNATRHVCSLNATELQEWNGGTVDEESALQMCFRASYSFQLLRNGYGFKIEDNITAANVVAGQKVGWALGSMLYEINTLPWLYVPRKEVREYNSFVDHENFFHFLGALVFCVFFTLMLILFSFRRRSHHHYKQLHKRHYSSINDVELE